MSKYNIGINEQVRIAWSEYYIHSLKNHCEIKKSMSILDYGCGFFNIGKLLLDQAKQIDGFDIDPERIELLQNIYKDKPNIQFFSQKGMIPDQSYDMIIMNSVTQYFKSENELLDVLIFLKDKLKETESSLIVSDIIPKTYSSLKDSLSLLLFSFKNKILFEILNEFFMAFLSGNHHSFFKLDIADFKRICRACGLSVRVLENNLTPSGSRYTCILSYGGK